MEVNIGTSCIAKGAHVKAKQKVRLKADSVAAMHEPNSVPRNGELLSVRSKVSVLARLDCLVPCCRGTPLDCLAGKRRVKQSAAPVKRSFDLAVKWLGPGTGRLTVRFNSVGFNCIKASFRYFGEHKLIIVM